MTLSDFQKMGMRIKDLQKVKKGLKLAQGQL